MVVDEGQRLWQVVGPHKRNHPRTLVAGERERLPFRQPFPPEWGPLRRIACGDELLGRLRVDLSTYFIQE